MKHSTVRHAILAMLVLGFNLGLAYAEPSVKVDAHDLDLRKPQDVATLYTRIEQRAARVCRDASAPWDGRRQSYLKQCTAGAIDAAVVQVNLESLTALHESKTGKAGKVASNRD